MNGDFKIEIAGNVFDTKDRDFLVDIMQRCHMHGFVKCVKGISVQNEPWNPRPADAPKEDPSK